jgi:hypothetical protein
VNRTFNDRAHTIVKKTILISKLLSTNENYSKVYVYFALGFKIRNHLLEIPFIKGFPKKYPEVAPISLKF